MNICLDTNAYSRLQLKPKPLCKVINTADTVYVPSIVLGELYAGFEIGSRKQENESSLDSFLAMPSTEIICPDKAVASRYGKIVLHLRKSGTPIPTNDIWIAASAMEMGARLLTYDTHFDAVPGLIILSP